MAFLDDRDLEELAQKIQAWLALQLDDDDLRVGDLDVPVGTGFSSDTMLFELVRTRDGHERREGMVIRLEPSEYITFPTYDIDLQYRVLQALGATDLPVPKVRWLERDKMILGAPFYIMDRIDGRVPSDNPPMHDEGWVAEELTPDERASLWWNGFDAMCAVHRLDWQKAGLGFLLDAQDPAHSGSTRRNDASLLDQQLDYYEGYFDFGVPRERHPWISTALDYLRSNQPQDEPVALCWGDCRPANQIFDGTACVALLDWEMVRLGNPLQDLAWWLASDRCFTEGLELERLQGFGSPQDTIARWERQTGFSARDLPYYNILALTRFSLQMARVGQHMKQLELIDEDNDFDRENLASIVLKRSLQELDT